MGYFCGKQDMQTLSAAQRSSFLLSNGLGGYASVTAAFSVPRCDQGILVAAVKAPYERITIVHRMRETLQMGENQVFLSSQGFAGRKVQEDGYRYLAGFSYEDLPVWTYQERGLSAKRTLCMVQEANTAAVLYEIEIRPE